MRDGIDTSGRLRRYGAGPALGMVEWFRPGEHDRVDMAIRQLGELGIEHLRTGFSWADYHAPAGVGWYDWLIPRLARSFELLPCFHYTPPSLSLDGATSGPPRVPKDFADFLDLAVTRYGRHFEWMELWNEPNNLNDWDWHLDRNWELFSEMIGAAAYWVRRRGKRTVLGGMCPTDPNWLALMGDRGVLDHIDVVGIHGFPGTWSPHWTGWAKEVEDVRSALQACRQKPAIWITEAGYSTWRHDEMRQLERLVELAEAPVERAYWYSLQDLDSEAPSQEGFHFDERHYHTGMVREDGSPKLLYRVLKKSGLDGARRQVARTLNAPAVMRSDPYVLVTGGAGFLGCNLAARLAEGGERVLVFDSLAREGVDENLDWLRALFPDRIAVEIGDVRDAYALRNAAENASAVIHLAAQVAVTSSLTAPMDDFEVNVRGTLNLLEALRRRVRPPPLLFASTNKVYGAFLKPDAAVREGQRYEPVDEKLRRMGVGEDSPLDLHTPYGCSKGAADQYVLDFARVFGIPAAVYRMSCLYGPHQFGTEDQGWVAHFLIAAMSGRPITIYGDGCQVRDVLYVDDAADAYLRGLRDISSIAGRAFNLGGGVRNTVSLRELLALIADLRGEWPAVAYDEWRPGDQLWYVSDTRRLAAATGWRPRVSVREGVERLHRWLTAALPRASVMELAARREGVAV